MSSLFYLVLGAYRQCVTIRGNYHTLIFCAYADYDSLEKLSFKQACEQFLVRWYRAGKRFNIPATPSLPSTYLCPSDRHQALGQLIQRHVHDVAHRILNGCQGDCRDKFGRR